jgi:hypothetical protein
MSRALRVDLDTDSDVDDAAKALLLAAAKFREVANARFGERVAVRWLEDAGGNLLVFTRGEYRQAIIEAVGWPSTRAPEREWPTAKRGDE